MTICIYGEEKEINMWIILGKRSTYYCRDISSEEGKRDLLKNNLHGLVD